METNIGEILIKAGIVETGWVEITEDGEKPVYLLII